MVGNNDFQIWDPNLTNIINLATYIASTDRLNGAVSGIAASNLYNKLFNQMSMMTTALGEVVKAQGGNATDSSLTNLVSALQTTIQAVAGSNNYLPLAGGNLAGVVNESMGASIASSATTNIGTATGNFVQITGTTTITSLGVAQAGAERTVEFMGSLTLTYNATSLILPGASNLVTNAGDIVKFRSMGSGNWICAGYEPAGACSFQNQKIVNVLAGVNNGDAVNMGQMLASLGTNGYQRLPSGSIVQWGTCSESSGITDYRYFPIVFPNKVCSMSATYNYGACSAGSWYQSIDNTKFIIGFGPDYTQGSTNPYMSWQAIGY